MTSEQARANATLRASCGRSGAPAPVSGGERRQLPHGAGAQIHEHAERRSSEGADRDERRASCHHLGARERQRLAETLPPVAFVGHLRAQDGCVGDQHAGVHGHPGHVEYQQAGKQGEQRDEGKVAPERLVRGQQVHHDHGFHALRLSSPSLSELAFLIQPDGQHARKREQHDDDGQRGSGSDERAGGCGHPGDEVHDGRG